MYKFDLIQKKLDSLDLGVHKYDYCKKKENLYLLLSIPTQLLRAQN